jgi:hypothetical protein
MGNEKIFQIEEILGKIKKNPKKMVFNFEDDNLPKRGNTDLRCININEDTYELFSRGLDWRDKEKTLIKEEDLRKYLENIDLSNLKNGIYYNLW